MASCSCSRIDYSYGVAGSRVVPTTTIRPLPSAVIFWGDPVGALAALLNNKVSPGDAAAQARAYAEQLGVPYVFLSNGDESEGVASRAAWRAG